VLHRQRIVEWIANENEDLSKTHVPLSALLSLPAGAAAAAGVDVVLLQQLAGAAAGMQPRQLLVAAAGAQPAAVVNSPAAAESGSASVREGSDVAAALAAAAAQAAQAADASAAAEVAAAVDLRAYAAAAGLQVYRLENLQQRAEAAEQVIAAGGQLQQHQLAVVPDASRPFTITMRSGLDGLDYVVAHYEPAALQHGSSKLVALLCEVG
jgi:hypothetical protein